MRNALAEDVLDKRMLLFMQVGTGFAEFCNLKFSLIFLPKLWMQNYIFCFFIKFSK